MYSPRARIGLLLLVFVALSGIAGLASNPTPLGLVINPTPSTIALNIWTNQSTYTIGQNAVVYFSVNQPAYVYIYDIQPDGITRLIFPNAYSQSNYVGAGTHTLPDGSYHFTVAPPTGQESLQAIASPVPLALELPYSEPFPMVAPNAGQAGADIQAHIMGIIPQPNYVTAWTSFMIVSGYSYTPPTPTPTPTPSTPPCYPINPFYPCPPFYGYAGGSWYWDGGQWVYGVPSSGWYWYWENGSWHFRIRICFGC